MFRVPQGGLFEFRLYYYSQFSADSGCLRYTGYVLGLVIESGIKHQEATPHPDPIHVTAHFLKSAMVGPYEVHLKDLKAGRDFKHISAAFVQNVSLNTPAMDRGTHLLRLNYRMTRESWSK